MITDTWKASIVKETLVCIERRKNMVNLTQLCVFSTFRRIIINWSSSKAVERHRKAVRCHFQLFTKTIISFSYTWNMVYNKIALYLLLVSHNLSQIVPSSVLYPRIYVPMHYFLLSYFLYKPKRAAIIIIIIMILYISEYTIIIIIYAIFMKMKKQNSSQEFRFFNNQTLEKFHILSNI